jgi:hypothetical protein
MIVPMNGGANRSNLVSNPEQLYAQMLPLAEENASLVFEYNFSENRFELASADGKQQITLEFTVHEGRVFRFTFTSTKNPKVFLIYSALFLKPTF